MGLNFGLNCKIVVKGYPTAAAVDFEGAQSWELHLKLCKNNLE
jgi:hypothetical protein